jgi:hypothetical protein
MNIITKLLRCNKYANVDNLGNGTTIALHLSICIEPNQQQILSEPKVESQYHVIIYKNNHRYWATIKVDDSKCPCPKKLMYCVFGLAIFGRSLKKRKYPN